jgi:menaquinone-dependent protoporphyrinogen oxidase
VVGLRSEEAIVKVLVAYATKYGATQGIAERICETIRSAGLTVDVVRCDDDVEPADYDAFIVGSAAYMFNWRKEARKFVRRNSDLLASRPTWLFSSGPLGTKTVDAEGKDVLSGAEPKQFAEYRDQLHPRGTQVFFGALDVSKLRGPDRMLSWMPANDALPEGDFRDWPAIEAWANGIANELRSARTA